MKIGIIGVGKLGLCFALLLERAGYDVIVSDSRKSHIENLKQKKNYNKRTGSCRTIKCFKKFHCCS